MKRLIQVLFMVAMLTILVLGYGSSVLGTTASAECPTGELYCQGWTPVDQALKVRRLTLEYVNANHSEFLKTCDSACLDDYDKASGGLLTVFAQKNGFDKTALLKTAKSLEYDWVQGFVSIYGRYPNNYDWIVHYPHGWEALATTTRSNNPVIILGGDDAKWCVTQEYGGTCSGKY